MHKNLIPNSQRTPEELREMTRKGGIASGEARRKKKAISEALKTLSEMKVKDVKQLSPKLTDMIKEQYGENVMEQTIAQVMGIRLMEKFFMLGDVQAFKEFTDRTEGKAEQAITGADGTSLAPPIINIIPVGKKNG